MKILLLLSVLLISNFASAQRVLAIDSIYNLSDSLKMRIEKETKTENDSQLRNFWAFDINISNGGFGLGGQYRTQLTKNLYSFVTFSINEAKDDKEVEYVDYWGASYVPGKINRFVLMPLFLNCEYRLFDNLLANNIRPFISLGGGATAIFVSPYNKDIDIFTSFKSGKSKYAIGGIVGIGANLGNEETGFTGLNIRYNFISYKDGIPSLKTIDNVERRKSDFGGIIVSLTFAKVIK
ncbi:MAG: hypothetical protein AAB255_01280 [Bacteroidota bacterium]